MTDFQVLPPGLSDIKYKGMPVDPMDVQLKGTQQLNAETMPAYFKKKRGVKDNKYQSLMYCFVEPLDEKYPDRDIPSFLPPSLFSKFDKPITYG